LSGVSIVVGSEGEGVGRVALFGCENEGSEEGVNTDQFSSDEHRVGSLGDDGSAGNWFVGGLVNEAQGRSISRSNSDCNVHVSVGDIDVRHDNLRQEDISVNKSERDLAVGVVVDGDNRGLIQSNNVEEDVEGTSVDNSVLDELNSESLVVESISWLIEGERGENCKVSLSRRCESTFGDTLVELDSTVGSLDLVASESLALALSASEVHANFELTTLRSGTINDDGVE